MYVFIDESGDLGWGAGGSLYLTVGLLFVPSAYKKEPEKVISLMYKTIGWKSEKKLLMRLKSKKKYFVIMLLGC